MPETIDKLEEENEKRGVELSIEQKKALIRKAQTMYGKDWRKFFPNITSGLDWEALKFRLQ